MHTDDHCYLCRHRKWSGVRLRALDGETFFVCWECERQPEGKQLIQGINHELFDAALVELELNKRCRFVERTGLYCRVQGHPFCKEHQAVKCSQCGQQATHFATRFAPEGANKPRCDAHGYVPMGDYSYAS